MFAYNRELENRDLINPENGLLPESTAHKVNLEANPFQKYIEGRDVVQDYQLPNMENERKLLASIAARMDPTKMLDASNIDPDRVDEDIMEQMVYEDTGNTNTNYMGLEPSDMAKNQRKATGKAAKFESLLQPAIENDTTITENTPKPNIPPEFLLYMERMNQYGQPAIGGAEQLLIQ